MQKNIYDLPEISFISGGTEIFHFRLFTAGKNVFNASGANATFSVVSSVNRMGTPIISKSMGVIANNDGVESILTITLTPSETVELFGKYIYQIILIDFSGEVEIQKGVLRISNNIDKDVIL